MKLTETRIRGLEPRPKQYIVFDDSLPGFGVRIGATGAKSYVIRYRVGGGRNGRQRRMVLAKCEMLSLESARNQARALLNDVRNGGDPIGQKMDFRNAPICKDLFGRFMDEHVIPRRAEKTSREYQLLIENHLVPAIGKLKVRDVDQTDIEALHRQLKPTPFLANRVVAVASKAFALAENWKLRDANSNPCRSIERYKEESRDRYFTVDEMGRIGSTLSDLEASGTGHNPGSILAIRLAALLGLRIGEVLSIEWENLDFETGTLTLPKTKTGRRVLKLPSAALAVLTTAPKISRFAIPGKNLEQPLNYKTVHKVWAKVRDLANVKNARIHDLRHTFATMAAASGAEAHVVRDLIGHKTMQMANLYVGRMNEPVFAAREKVAGQIGDAFVVKVKQRSIQLRGKGIG